MSSIEIEDDGLVRNRGTDHEERIRWRNLIEVRIVTTDQGPWVEDIFWLLVGADGQGVAIEGAHIGPILPLLQKLPRFDNEAVITAAASTEDAQFEVWNGAAGEGAILERAPS